MLQTATKSTTAVSLTTFKQWLKVTSMATKTISSLSAVGSVATAVCANHGYATNAFVVIAGAVQSAYNGSFLITVVDANTFTYPMASSPTSPATGTPTVTPDDGRLAAMVDSAADDFENVTDVPIVTRSVTDQFDGDGKCAHALSVAPVVSITSFTIDGVAVDASTYVLDKATGIIRFTSGGFTCGIQNVIITFTAGYDVQDGAALPSDVVVAILDLAKAAHDQLVSNAIAASSVSLGPSSMVIKPSQRPASVQRVFDNYAGKGMRP